MARTTANVNILTDSFENWVDKTNELAYALESEIVTVGANATGATATGNTNLNGILGANTVVVYDSLRGGSLSTSGALSVPSVLNIANSATISGDATISGNLVFDSVNIDNIVQDADAAAGGYANTDTSLLSGDAVERRITVAIDAAATNYVQTITSGSGIVTTPADGDAVDVTVTVKANNGTTANSSGLFVKANTGLTANTTGLHIDTTGLTSCTSPTSSDTIMVRSGGALKSSTIAQAALQGPKGQKGVKGATGSAGSTGSSGPTGAKGEKGQKGGFGGTGGTGIKGEKGQKGTTGTSGTAGAKGQKGTTGSTGPKGAVGPTGPTGAKGSTGTKGQKGAPGPTGSKGNTGAQGPTGAKGDIGATGPTGDDGAAGAKGDTGFTGPTGPKGQKGLGVKGDTGPTGTKGQKGTIGAQGPTGPKGQKGNEASNATTLDGIDSTQFLRSDQSDTMSGNLTVTGSINGRAAASTTTTGTLVAGDANDVVIATGDITVPSATFTARDIVMVSSSSARTITRGSGLSMYFNGTNSASLTLAANGTMGILFVSASVCHVFGNVS